jgi:hypothetical protein
LEAQISRSSIRKLTHRIWAGPENIKQQQKRITLEEYKNTFPKQQHECQKLTSRLRGFCFVVIYLLPQRGILM